MWPIEGLPFLLKCIGYVFPFALPVTAFRNILIKDSTICDQSVYLAFAIMSIWIIAQLFLGHFFIRDKEGSKRKDKK